jgi:hypothetical protein
MQQALWFRTQAEDYLTLSQERRLTKGKKTLLRVLIAKTPAFTFSKRDLQRLLAKRAAKRAKNILTGANT